MYEYRTAIETTENYDVIVCGAGTAGIAAAIAASRNGAKTVLVEKNGIPGGTATAGYVSPFMTSYSLDGKTEIIKGIFKEVVDGLVEVNGAVNPSQTGPDSIYSTDYLLGHTHNTPFDADKFALLSMEMINEAGVKLLLHSYIVDVIKEGKKVKGVIIDTPSEKRVLFAPVIIDCTGDGVVALRAGAEYRFGRESDGLTQPMSVYFAIENVDDNAVSEYKKAHPDKKGFLYNDIIEKVRLETGYELPRDRLNLYKMLNPGEWKVCVSRVLRKNGLISEDLTDAEFQGRRQVYEIYDFMKTYVPGFENIRIKAIAPEIGKRETVHIKGEYTVKLEDLTKPEHFYDTIALGAYPVDIHSPSDRHGGPVADKKTTADVYELPYRMLIPKGVEGLLIAGRIASATHEANAAIRVMSTCFALGQAAGTAAALSVKNNTEPRNIDIEELRKQLIGDNAVLR